MIEETIYLSSFEFESLSIYSLYLYIDAGLFCFSWKKKEKALVI